MKKMYVQCGDKLRLRYLKEHLRNAQEGAVACQGIEHRDCVYVYNLENPAVSMSLE